MNFENYQTEKTVEELSDLVYAKIKKKFPLVETQTNYDEGGWTIVVYNKQEANIAVIIDYAIDYESFIVSTDTFGDSAENEKLIKPKKSIVGVLNTIEKFLAPNDNLCRCGNKLHKDEVMNALSKNNNEYICKDCERKELEQELEKLMEVNI